jgi:hypothetical protein
MTSTAFTSIPNTTAFAIRAYRQWKGIPDSVTDQDAINSGAIDPALIALILQIVQEVIQCIPNSRSQAFQRVKSFTLLKPFEKLADNMRMNSFINKWASNLAIPREPGDVVMIRESIAHAAGDFQDEADFAKIQIEVLWLTI